MFTHSISLVSNTLSPHMFRERNICNHYGNWRLGKSNNESTVRSSGFNVNCNKVYQSLRIQSSISSRAISWICKVAQLLHFVSFHIRKPFPMVLLSEFFTKPTIRSNWPPHQGAQIRLNCQTIWCVLQLAGSTSRRPWHLSAIWTHL